MSTLCRCETEVEIGEWRAVVVNNVNEDKYRLASARGDDISTILPTCSVRVSAADKSVCILSWRWDIKTNKTSKNVMCALRLARQLGFHYLLVDFISIDQSLTKLNNGELSKQILRFSQLFSILPVIAAYDSDEVDEEVSLQGIRDYDYGYLHSAHSFFLRTIKRPWIFTEIQRFRHNPIPVMYVGHNSKGGATVCINRSEFRSEEVIPLMYGRSFARSVVGVLCGSITMTSISEFRYLLPKYHDLLILAYDRWSRNDYLLTVALLSMLSSHDNDVDGGNDPNAIILDLEQYDFIYDPKYLHDSSREAYYIHLNGTRIAHWYYKDNDYGRTKQSRLTVDPNARGTILTALEMPHQAVEDDALNHPSKCSCPQPYKIQNHWIELDPTGWQNSS